MGGPVAGMHRRRKHIETRGNVAEIERLNKWLNLQEIRALDVGPHSIHERHGSESADAQ